MCMCYDKLKNHILKIFENKIKIPNKAIELSNKDELNSIVNFEKVKKKFYYKCVFCRYVHFIYLVYTFKNILCIEFEKNAIDTSNSHRYYCTQSDNLLENMLACHDFEEIKLIFYI